jgi:hypothetical protein
MPREWVGDARPFSGSGTRFYQTLALALRNIRNSAGILIYNRHLSFGSCIKVVDGCRAGKRDIHDYGASAR